MECERRGIEAKVREGSLRDRYLRKYILTAKDDKGTHHKRHSKA